MTNQKISYCEAAENDARETISNFADEIAEKARDGEVSDDLYNDYDNGDGYHHESHVDKDYDLQEAAELLDQLSEYEETDHGLWEGLEPRRAIAAQAAYTYGNAVIGRWSDLIKELNEFLEDVEGEDQREAFTRLWIIYVCDYQADVNGEGEEWLLARTAFQQLERGNPDAGNVLADWLEEHDKRTHTTVRELCAKAMTEPETEGDDE